MSKIPIIIVWTIIFVVLLWLVIVPTKVEIQYKVDWSQHTGEINENADSARRQESIP